jgi:hypothetical protein
MNDDPESTLARSFRQSLLSAEAEAPSFDDVADYVDGRLSGEARVLFEERLREDPLLQAEVSDLRELRGEMARPRRTTAPVPAWTYLAAAAVIAAAVAGFLLTRDPQETQVATAPAAGVPPASVAGEPAVVAAVHDGTGAIQLRADGTLRGGAQIPPALAPSVVRALREGALTIPALRADLSVAPVTAMGRGGTGARFAPVGPLSTIVLSDRPTLRWSAHPRALSYEVSVFDLDLEPVASSAAIAATEWTPPAALRRGRTYLWQVRATTAAGSETVPAPPAPEARFHVASAAAVAAVEPALASGSDLAAGVALAEAGFLEEAAQRIDALAAGNAGSREVQRLREALATARKR